MRKVLIFAAMTMAMLPSSSCFADPPKVTPSVVDAKVGVPFLIRVESSKKVGIDGGLDPKKFDVAEVIVGSGVYFITPLEGSQGSHKVRYWTIGDKIVRTIHLDEKPPAEDSFTIPLVSVINIKVAGEVKQPPKRPDDPKQPPATGYYFMLIRSDGAADPSFTKIIRDPSWAKLVELGHQVKDFQLQDAVRFGAKLPDGTSLPCIITLRTDGSVSRVVRGPIPLPSDSQGILDLPKGVTK